MIEGLPEKVVAEINEIYDEFHESVDTIDVVKGIFNPRNLYAPERSVWELDLYEDTSLWVDNSD